LGDLREQLVLLGTRAGAIKRSVQTMQAEQNRTGVGMRPDVTAGMQRMEFYLDETEAALRAGDPAKGKKSLSSAEKEVGKLENFMGR
jgi:hypothetical protein